MIPLSDICSLAVTSGRIASRSSSARVCSASLAGGTGAVRDELVQHQDFFPTICRLMGFEPDPGLGLDGRDFLGGSAQPPERIIAAWGRNVSVRDPNWNMVIDSTLSSERRELYDLTRDPSESENVYEDHADVVRELTEYLESTLGELPYEIKHVGDRRQAPPLSVNFRDRGEIPDG